MVDIWRVKVEGNRFLYEETKSRVEPGKDGVYQIAGLKGVEGSKPVKCYLIIPFPFGDRAGWIPLIMIMIRKHIDEWDTISKVARQKS